jgi:RNA polymerase sigma factor FliA
MQQQNSPEIMARINEGFPWVDVVARYLARSLGHLASMEDLSSYGQLGLLKAARQFDPQKSPSFRAFAKLCIEREIISGCRENTPRRVLEARTGVGRVRSEGAEAAKQDSSRRLHQHAAGINGAKNERILAELGSDTLGEGIAISGKTSAEEVASRAEQKRRLRSAIDQLPADQSLALRRFIIDEATIDQIAAELRLTRMQVRYLLDQGKDALKKMLGERP